MKHLEGILELVDKEFGRMEQNGEFRNKEDIELAYKLIDIAKDTYCIWDYEDKIQDGYSEYGNYPYENRSSYARGRNIKRNGMGQFTSREGMTTIRSRNRNYSRANAEDEYLENLYDMLDYAPNDRVRDNIQRMINEYME